MTRLRGRSRRWCGWALCAVVGCSTARSAESAPPAAKKPPTAHAELGGWFELTGASCRAEQIGHRLVSQPPRRSDVRVTRDVRALSVTLACKQGDGSPLDPDSVLARGVALSLLGPDGRAHPTRMRPADSQEPSATPFTLDFELERDEPLARARHGFDARSGAAKASEPAGTYTLVLSTSRERVEVTLRQPFETDAFDAALAAIARALASGEGLARLGSAELEAPLDDVQQAYRELAARYAPRLMRIEPSLRGAEITLTIGLDELARSAQLAEPLSLTLALAPEGASYRIARCESPAALRRAVRCATLEQTLDESIGHELDGQAGEGDCSVLGYKLPGECDALSSKLREQAFALGEACAPGLELPAAAVRPPDDLQVVLRRGRRARGTERDARSTLVLFRNGHVVFHRPSAGGESVRKNGRTAPRLVERLYAHIEQLAWFGRRGGDFDPTRCAKDADSGDVITVVAGGRERMIPNRDGCRGPFGADELELFAQRIAAVGGARGFGARSREARDPRVRIWTVTPD